MISHNYSYERCLENSLKVYWDADKLLEGKNFDFSKLFLPDSMVGASRIPFLSDDEKRTFNQISGNAYFHMFQFLEEPIAPMIMETALPDATGDEVKLRCLLRFCEEEVKHQAVFQAANRLFAKGIGMECGLLSGKAEVAQAVLAAPRLSAMLLIQMIEWITQTHYLEHVKDAADLDPLFSDILRFHWMEEAQHTKLDAMLIDEMVADMSLEEREAAVDGLLELCGAVDGLIRQQAELNAESLGRVTGRTFTEEETATLVELGYVSVRFGLMGLALQHPQFVQTIKDLTENGEAKIAAAARSYTPAAA